MKPSFNATWRLGFHLEGTIRWKMVLRDKIPIGARWSRDGDAFQNFLEDI
jgi:hypothetical protein